MLRPSLAIMLRPPEERLRRSSFYLIANASNGMILIHLYERGPASGTTQVSDWTPSEIYAANGGFGFFRFKVNFHRVPFLVQARNRRHEHLGVRMHGVVEYFIGCAHLRDTESQRAR